MKIIDKNTDFYDYYQNIYIDNTFTFDRTDSFVLTKDMMCQYLNIAKHWYWRYQNQYFLILQICNTFWLFLITVTKETNDSFKHPTEYTLNLIHTWKNYNRSRVLCDLSIINFDYDVLYQYKEKYPSQRLDVNKVLNHFENFIQAINSQNYKILYKINNHTVYVGNTKVIKHIPLLKACGISNCVDPLDVFLSFEEYFSLEKMSIERREPLGTTDIDKIESHGFDKKISFRGK